MPFGQVSTVIMTAASVIAAAAAVLALKPIYWPDGISSAAPSASPQASFGSPATRQDTITLWDVPTLGEYRAALKAWIAETDGRKTAIELPFYPDYNKLS